MLYIIAYFVIGFIIASIHARLTDDYTTDNFWSFCLLWLLLAIILLPTVIIGSVLTGINSFFKWWIKIIRKKKRNSASDSVRFYNKHSFRY